MPKVGMGCPARLTTGSGQQPPSCHTRQGNHGQAGQLPAPFDCGPMYLPAARVTAREIFPV
jgi:hypothetical protein